MTKHTKSVTFGIILVLAIFSIFSGISYTIPHAYAAKKDKSKEISLNYSKRKVIYGIDQYLSDIEAYNASGSAIDSADIKWKSDDKSVATVKYGTVFIKGIGKAVITADYNGHIASLALEVIEPKVSINKSELKGRHVGDKCTDWYTSTKGIKVTAKSGNKKVVQLNENGSLKVLALGESEIMVKAKGGNTAKYTMNINKCDVYVSDDKTFSLEKYIKYIPNYEKAVWTASKSGYIETLPDGTMKPLKSGKISLSTTLNDKNYKITLRITNYKLMKELAMDSLKDTLRYPASLSVNSITRNGRKITIDYSSMNKYGGYDRGRFILKIDMEGKYTSKTVSIYD